MGGEEASGRHRPSVIVARFGAGSEGPRAGLSARGNNSAPRRFGGGKRSGPPRECIFLLTFGANDFIYESHCDLFRLQILMSREKRSMKNATKKAAKKKAAPKKKGK
jgi:hypothetical protein